MREKATRLFTAISGNDDYKKIVKNLFSLATIQITNFLVPILLLPYLVRTLGLSGYGVVVFAQTIMGYFESVMQYSFSLTAVSEVSQVAKSKQPLHPVVSRVLSAKIVLAIVSAMVLVVLALAVPKFAELKILLMLGTLYCIGSLLNFEWFFQGVQEMKHVTALNLLARAFSLLWVFTMVKTEEDIWAAFLTVPLGYILTGICSVYIIRRKFQIQFFLATWKNVIAELKQGLHIFYAQIMVRFYSADINITILGMVADSTTVGIYALAQRIFALFMVLTNLITVVVFPYLSGLMKVNVQEYQRKTKQVYGVSFVAFALLSIAVFTTAPWLVYFVSGQQNALAVLCLRILSLALLLSPFPPLNNQVFIIGRRTKWMPVLTSMAVVVNVLAVVPLYLIWQLQGIAMANVIVFAFLTIGGYFAIRKEQLLFSNPKVVGFE